MNSREIHKSKDEENTDSIAEINNIKNNISKKTPNLYENNIYFINENTTLFATKKEYSEKELIPEQKANLSKGKLVKKIKFKYQPIKRGPYFMIQKKRKRGRNSIKTLNFRISKHSIKNCDNMLRKIKSWVIFGIIKYINKKLEEVNKNRKKNKLRLYAILKKQSYNTNIDYNRQLLGKKIDDILSVEVSKKTKINSKHNKIIIDKIKEEKYDNIIKILNLTLLECIDHYIEKKSIDCLDGFEEEFKLKNEKIANYKDRFLEFVKNIEKYLFDKNFRIEMNKKKTKSK